MELSSVAQLGLIGVVIIVIALLFAHRYLLPSSLFQKEDPQDQRIVRDLPEAPGIDNDIITEVMRTGQPVERTILRVKVVGMDPITPEGKEQIRRLIEAENDPRSGFRGRQARLNTLRAFGFKGPRL